MRFSVRVVHKFLYKGKVLYVLGVGNLQARTSALYNAFADGDVFFVIIGYGQVSVNHLSHVVFKFLNVKLLVVVEFQYESVAYIREVIAVRIDALVVLEYVTGDFFGGVRHLAVLQRLVHNVVNAFRKWSEHRWTCYDNLFTDANNEVGIPS